MTRPLLIPLPSPMSTAASENETIPVVNGTAIRPRPMSSIAGTATQIRPKRSMILPAG